VRSRKGSLEAHTCGVLHHNSALLHGRRQRARDLAHALQQRLRHGGAQCAGHRSSDGRWARCGGCLGLGRGIRLLGVTGLSGCARHALAGAVGDLSGAAVTEELATALKVNVVALVAQSRANRTGTLRACRWKRLEGRLYIPCCPSADRCSSGSRTARGMWTR
jgi:hypothetical protein